MRTVVVLVIAHLGLCSSAAGGATNLFGPVGERTISAPFEFVIDVNGTERRIEAEGYGRLRAEVDGSNVVSIRPTGWRQVTTSQTIGFHNGTRYKVVLYPLTWRKGWTSTPRLFTNTYRWTGDGVGENFGFQAYEQRPFPAMTEPMVAEGAEQLTPHSWRVQDISGLRWKGDIVLFDQIVGGERFTVRLKEYGFKDWGDLLMSDRNIIPEPSSWALLLAVLPVVLLWRSRGAALWRIR